MTFRLPPLNALRLFEAAGRRESFKLAAEELKVTPSAVSHGIQTLEEWLGTPLFNRAERGLTLTRAGETYLAAVAEALSTLALASDRVGRRRRQVIAVSAAPTFGERVLLPRLRRFQEVCPGVAVHIDTSHHVVQFPRDGFDLAIRVGAGSWPGLASIKLLEERLVPVCAPKLLDRPEGRGPLAAAALIHVTSASQDWAVWGREAGVDPGDPKRGLMVDTIQLALDAAAQGLGVAIGRRPFIEEELASGVLARFCGPEVPSNAPYWLVAPSETFLRPEIKAFRDWLIAEAQALWGPPAAE